jgi:NAD(P)-dependent dehydrogenase (short-subunit alcohol dehydrogenase family)
MLNKTIVITGGSSGIGAAAARALRKQGATVAITGRSAETQRLADEIGADAFIADYSRLSDVRELAAQLLAKYPRIDVLANNAGGVIGTHQLTEDHHEKTLQINHLGGFLLTLLLRERLEESRGVVINTSSRANRTGYVTFENLEGERGYSSWRAYGSSKLINILHAAEISRRFNGVRGVSFHPGVVATKIAREGSRLTRVLWDSVLNVFLLSPEKGADTLVWLATTDDWTPGAFYVKRKPAATHAQAVDAKLAREIWDWSERAVVDARMSQNPLPRIFV